MREAMGRYRTALIWAKLSYQFETSYRLWYASGLLGWDQYREQCERARLRFHAEMRFPHAELEASRAGPERK